MTFTHPLAAPMLIATLVWMALYSLVMRRLRKHHASTSQGTTGLGGFNFILTRQHTSLGDKRLSQLSDLALAYFLPYICFFAYVLLKYPQTAA